MLGRALVFFLLFETAAFAADLKPASSAEICGDCHRAIYAGWKTSAHAAAMESRLFQDALKLADAELGAGARRVCLNCHAPVASRTGDLELIKKVSWEGVTCDYCHSIQDVTLTGVNPEARVEFTLVKSGPSKDSSSPVHGTVFSPVHVSSLACVSCHEYKNSLGFPVLTTYSEWKKSAYAGKSQECQSCHMYRVSGDVVDPRVQRSSQTSINLHQMPGSHSPDQLNKAIRASLTTTREDDQLRVVITVINAGAGHYVPTGSPLREVRLELRADSYDGRHFQEERIYRRSVADQKGAVLNREHFAFMRAAKVVEDTRLAPNETRTETFSFPIPSGTRARVEASFYYYFSPMATTEAQQRAKFLNIARFVP